MFKNNIKPLTLGNFKQQKLFMNIVELISKWLENNGRTKTYLAEKLGVPPQHLINKFSRNKTFDIDFIERVSIALNHDFFEDLSKLLQSEKSISLSNSRVSLVSEPPSSYHSEREKSMKAQYDQLLQENLELHRELRKLYKDLKN